MSYADREMIVSSFTLAVIFMVVGCIVQFTYRDATNHVVGYGLLASGVVLFFATSVARANRVHARLLRTLLTLLAGMLLAGMLFKDALERLV